MFNRRFSPYIITIGTIAFLSICFVGHKAYQKHVEFEDFISEAKIFQIQRNLDIGHRSGSSQNADDSGEENKGSTVSPGAHASSNKTSSGKYQYNSDAVGKELSDFQKQDLVSRFMEFSSGLAGNPDSEHRSFFMSPEESEFFFSQDNHEINGRSVSTISFESVTQLVETPDGEIHEVFVPRNWAYQDGDAISRSELAPRVTRQISESITMDGVKYDMPKEYFTMDAYEQHQYKKKLTLAHYNGIAIDEVERRIAAGEIEASSLSLSEGEKRQIDESERVRMEREQALKPPLLDQSTVKVRFLADDQTGPGWLQDVNEFIAVLGPPEGTKNSRNDTTLPFVSPQGEVEVPDGFDTQFDEAGRSPVGQVHLHREAGHVYEPPTVQTATPPTTENVETQLKGQLSLEQFDKAQQLIDEYGTEEGLRRLRESDPEAARQFERLAAPKGRSPEQEQREQKMDTEP